MTSRRDLISRPSRSARQGTALVVAMICLLLVSMLSAVLVRTALAQRDQLQRDAWQLQAEWLAQAGLERALSKLQSDADYVGETWAPAGDDGRVIGGVEIRMDATAEATGGRIARVIVNVPNDPVNRAHVEREVLVPAANSSNEDVSKGVIE